jgi:competence protein ComEC
MALAVAVLLGGWWWGAARLDALDQSALAGRIGTAERARIVITAPPRASRFDVRAQGVVVRFGRARVREAVVVRLARAPPRLRQGAILDGIALLTQPKPPKDGFDERTWLRRHGIHVVVRLDAPHVVGFRGGLAGWIDSVRRWLAASATARVHGERAALLVGIVLGDDSHIHDTLRQRFRASGLYHLLAVSGQNVALVAAGALAFAWLLGVSRLVGHGAALVAILLYVLAVGAQPSVVRAGIAGGLASVAWLTGRLTDRWHFLWLGAAALLAWNPYTLFDAGFQLSFVAVAAIFVLVPRIREVLDGYPIPRLAGEAIAISAACGLVTAPILWIQFHAISLVAIPANVLVAPVMPAVLALAFVGAALALVAPIAAAVASVPNGWLAAYIAWCARFTGGLPGAQITSTRALLALLAGGFLCAAYACDTWRPRSSPST